MLRRIESNQARVTELLVETCQRPSHAPQTNIQSIHRVSGNNPAHTLRQSDANSLSGPHRPPFGSRIMPSEEPRGLSGGPCPVLGPSCQRGTYPISCATAAAGCPSAPHYGAAALHYMAAAPHAAPIFASARC